MTLKLRSTSSKKPLSNELTFTKPWPQGSRSGWSRYHPWYKRRAMMPWQRLRACTESCWRGWRRVNRQMLLDMMSLYKELKFWKKGNLCLLINFCYKTNTTLTFYQIRQFSKNKYIVFIDCWKLSLKRINKIHNFDDFSEAFNLKGDFYILSKF